VTMWKMGACISCKIKIFRITPLSSAFTGHFCSAQADKLSVITENLHRLPPVVHSASSQHDGARATGLFALEEVARCLGPMSVANSALDEP